jgi:hypothetical protein
MGYDYDRREEGYMHIIKMLRVPETFEHSAVCPECGSPKLIHEGRDMYCLSCSLAIIEE